MSAWTWLLDKVGYEVKWEAHKLGRWSDGSLTGFMVYLGLFNSEEEAYTAAGAGGMVKATTRRRHRADAKGEGR